MGSNQLWVTGGGLFDPKPRNSGSSLEHLLLSQNHFVIGFLRYPEGSVRRWADLRRFWTDRDEHGSDVGAGRDRSVPGTRLFRGTGRETFDESERVDMAQVEPEDLDVKTFVLARTPLLASMGRWVILSNGKKAIKNTAKKRVITKESADRDVYQQTTSSKARSRHASLRNPRWVLVRDEERVTMRMRAAKSLYSYCVLWSSTTTLEATL